jgi:uncharacterized protein
MVEADLLDILVCPETKRPVRLAEPEFLERVNRAINEGKLENRAGERVTETLEAALVREGDDLLYPVHDGIPVMLIDEAVSLDPLS